MSRRGPSHADVAPHHPSRPAHSRRRARLAGRRSSAHTDIARPAACPPESVQRSWAVGGGRRTASGSPLIMTGRGQPLAQGIPGICIGPEIPVQGGTRQRASVRRHGPNPVCTISAIIGHTMAKICLPRLSGVAIIGKKTAESLANLGGAKVVSLCLNECTFAFRARAIIGDSQRMPREVGKKATN